MKIKINKNNFNDKNLLEHLMNKNIPVEYQCKEGYCGSCRCRLEKGQVNKTQDSLAFTQKDEILLCCSKPDSDIEIHLFD